jgi:hypothetical protein
MIIAARFWLDLRKDPTCSRRSHTPLLGGVVWEGKACQDNWLGFDEANPFAFWFQSGDLNRGLVDGQIAAGGANDFKRGVRLGELEAVAKGVPLATDCINCNLAQRKREIQFHHLAQGNFNSQHGCDSGFADVHSTSRQHTGRPRMNPDIDLKFEPGMAAGIDRNCCHGGAALYIGKGTDLSAQ